MPSNKKVLSKSQAIMTAVRDAPEGASTVELAKIAGVSQSHASFARVILERRPDLVESVIDGSMSVSKAYAQVRPVEPRRHLTPVARAVLTQENAEQQLDHKHDLAPEVRAELATRLCDAINEENAVYEEASELLAAARERKHLLMSVLSGLSAQELEQFIAVTGVDLTPEPEPETEDDDEDEDVIATA